MYRLPRLIKGWLRSRGVAALLAAALIPVAGCGKPSLVAPGGSDAAAGGSGGTPASQATKPAASPPHPASANEEPKPPPRPSPIQVRVFYATDRSRTGQKDPSRLFGGARGALSFGYCDVNVPRLAKEGKPEPAAAVPAPSEHYPQLRSVVPREVEPYLSLLSKSMAKSNRREALVFVPGFDAGFADAARVTAQLKHALSFQGAALFFSWPSKARREAYLSNQADVEWAQPDLKQFLRDLAEKTGAQQIHLVAHGMGARALAKAYVYLVSERPELKKVFREVILVAADIDAEQFRRDLAPALAASGCRTTLYCSSRDPAIRTAKKLQEYPRAGESGANLPLWEGIETIDAGPSGTVLALRGELADNPPLLTDLQRLIRDGKKPQERPGLLPVARWRAWAQKRSNQKGRQIRGSVNPRASRLHLPGGAKRP